MCENCFKFYTLMGESPPYGVNLVGHRKPTKLEVQNGLKLESVAMEVFNKHREYYKEKDG